MQQLLCISRQAGHVLALGSFLFGSGAPHISMSGTPLATDRVNSVIHSAQPGFADHTKYKADCSWEGVSVCLWCPLSVRPL